MPSEHFSSEIEVGQNTRQQFEAARDGLDEALYDEQQARLLAGSGVQSQLNSLDNRLDAAESAIDLAEGAIATQGLDIDALQTQMTAIYPDVFAHESEIVNARGGQASLDARLDTMDATDATLAASVTGVAGGATVSDARLKEWVEAEAFELTAITYDATYLNVISTATVKWPDGSGGTLTTTDIDTDVWATDAYTVSHTLSGNTVTQASVTRNGEGNIVTKPALTVS